MEKAVFIFRSEMDPRYTSAYVLLNLIEKK